MKNVLMLLLLPLGLVACGESNVDEVQKWMDLTKSQTRPLIVKLSEPKKFTPFSYEEKDKVDPFNPTKLSVVLAKLRDQGRNGVKPDLDRRREPLESVSLDTLKMVGTLTSGTSRYALLQSDAKMVYQAKVGNYVGQNFGLIMKINDDSIEIKEIVLDGAGDWVERPTTLELQEAKK
jgi:type IV pilus assembly protein PilP